jgi:excisionase family DNA binding protein
MSSERISYKVSEAAKVAGVSRYVLYDAIRAGDLRAWQPNPRGDRLILAEDLRAWVTRFPAPVRTRDVGNDADPIVKGL